MLWLPGAVNAEVLESLSACFHHFFKADKLQQFGRFYNQAPTKAIFLLSCSYLTVVTVLSIITAHRVAVLKLLTLTVCLHGLGLLPMARKEPLLHLDISWKQGQPSVLTPSWPHLPHNKDLS